jgi:hypothetical protein
MDKNPTGDHVVPASLPDYEVPSVLVEIPPTARRKAKRADRFLKGPIPLSWVREHLKNPADRLLLVLCAHADMRQSVELKVTADIERDAQIGSRKIRYRALLNLEANGAVEVARKPGSRPMVRLLASPGNWLVRRF